MSYFKKEKATVNRLCDQINPDQIKVQLFWPTTFQHFTPAAPLASQASLYFLQISMTESERCGAGSRQRSQRRTAKTSLCCDHLKKKESQPCDTLWDKSFYSTHKCLSPLVSQVSWWPGALSKLCPGNKDLTPLVNVDFHRLILKLHCVCI